MASEATAIPSWIEASLFEPVIKEIVTDYKQIKEFKVSPALKAGENYATVMLRIEVEVELNDATNKSISLMLKTAHDSELFRKIMKSHNVFEVEACMYCDVVPEFEQIYREAGVNVRFGPKSYKLRTDEPYILLEDLRPEGFKNENRLEGLDMEHSFEVLKILSQWHAVSAVRTAIKGPYKASISESFFKEETRAEMQGMFDGIANAFLKCAQTYDGSDLYYERLCEMKSKRIDQFFEACKVDPNEFNVLNHGDCWSNNVMFQHDDFGKIIKTYLVDYQVPKYGTPAQDLYYFLLSSTRYELKTKQFDYFIKYYHDNLIENLRVLNYTKNIPSLRDIHIILHKYNPFGLSACSGVMAAVLLDPNDNASIDNMLGDSDVGMELQLQMFSNPRYRKHIEMLLPWLYYRGGL